MAKQVCLLAGALCSGVLLEQQVEALGCLVTALEDRAVLQGVWITAPAVKDVMIIPCHGLHIRTRLGFRARAYTNWVRVRAKYR